MQNRLIDWERDWDIRLLEKSTLIGKHADLYSHTLYLDLIYEGLDANYTSVNGRRNETNKPKIDIKLHSETIVVYYTPCYSDTECAFEIEFSAILSADTSDFEVIDNKLIYKISKIKVAEEYFNASYAIIKFLKTV